MRLVVGGNTEIFGLVPRRGDVGVARSTSRSRNDGNGQKSRDYEYELTARDTKVYRDARRPALTYCAAVITLRNVT